MNTPKEASPDPVGFWGSLWQSITTFTFYRRIQRQAFTRSLKYLFILAIALGLLMGHKIYRDFSGALTEWTAWWVSNIPQMHIQEGEVSIHALQPKTIEEDTAVLILDTTGETQAIEKKYHTGMIVAKDRLILKGVDATRPWGPVGKVEQFIRVVAYVAGTVQPQFYEGHQFRFEGIRSLELTQENVHRWGELLRGTMSLAIPLLHAVFFVAGRLMQALFFALVLSYSHRHLREKGISFERILNVAIYALTPPVLFSTLLGLFSLQIPLQDWVTLGMYVAFLLGGINACAPREKPAAPKADPPDDWIDF